MTPLSEIGEAITDTLFIALVIIRLPMMARLRNYDEEQRTGHGHIAMQAVRKRKVL